MPESKDPLDRIANELQDSLANIGKHARTIERGKEALDPDATIAAFDAETRNTYDLLAQLMAAVDQESTAAVEGVDLVSAVDTEIKSLCKSVGFPLVVDLRLQADLPRVRVEGRVLTAVLDDLLHLGAHAAGKGGTLMITSRRGDDEVALLIEAHGGEQAHDTPPVALEDLVTELGGRLLCERGEDGVFRAGIALFAAVAIE